MKRLFLLTLAAVALIAADATGKWTGNLIITGPDGTERRPPAHLELKQDGTTLTGTAGPDGSERYPIQNGRIEDGLLKFETASGNAVMKFSLKQEGDEIKGDVTRERDGNADRARIEVKRAK